MYVQMSQSFKIGIISSQCTYSSAFISRHHLKEGYLSKCSLFCFEAKKIGVSGNKYKTKNGLKKYFEDVTQADSFLKLSYLLVRIYYNTMSYFLIPV